LDLFEPAPSFQGQIGYHIFLDRFKNGNLLNDPNNVVEWTSQPTRENVFGGDIEGLRQSIPYLVEMGIGVVFLLPIFYAHSNHKYDTIDYFQIDPNYGTMDEFKKLVKELHKADIKLILDGVFNHIGYYSPIFQDVIEKGKESIYFDWFYIHGDTVDVNLINYECVGDYKWMPKLNYASRSLRDYIRSIGEYWIKEADIDGWRLDVADEVDFTFWIEFRQALKPIKDIFLVAETWKDGKDLLRGDQMDSVMNYRLRELIIQFLTNEALTVKRLNNRIEKWLFEYPEITHSVLYNHLSSHDTERIANALNHDDKSIKLAMAMQMLLPGMPVIYYGDELKMTGETDPDSRKAMDWTQVNNDMHNYVKHWVAIRKAHPSLLYGDYQTIVVDFDIYSFIRHFENETLLVLINRNQFDKTIVISAKDITTFVKCDQANDLTVCIPAIGYRLIKCTTINSTIKMTIL
jgi:glycosidase